jgi:hypothetical protein
LNGNVELKLHSECAQQAEIPSVHTNRAPKSSDFAIQYFATVYLPLCPALYFFGFWRPNISCSAWVVCRASGNRAKNSRRRRHKAALL